MDRQTAATPAAPPDKGDTQNDPPNDLATGAEYTFDDGKTYRVGVWTTQPTEDQDDDRPSGNTLTLSVECFLQPPPETRATFDEAPHLRRINGVIRHAPRRTRPIGRRTGRHEIRPARTKTRRVGAGSATSGSDPGDSEPGEYEPPRSVPRCQACGADISHRRADAKTCDARCRKALNRGKIASHPRAVRPSRSLEDEIDGRAHQRHLAWSAARPNRALIDDLAAELEGLYAELRRQRARRALDGFPLRSTSVVALPAPPLRRPWRDSQSAYRQREAVAA